MTLALLLAVPSSRGDAAPGSFVIAGNSGISRETLLDTTKKVSCQSLDSACVDAVCKALAEAYWSKGYLKAEIRCKRSSEASDTVRVEIIEGPPSLLEAVSIQGASADGEAALQAIFAPRRGAPLSQPELEADLDRSLAYYDGRGYPLAKIVPEIEVLGEDRLELVLRVDEGPNARIGTITVRGLQKTRQAVVMREMALRPGQPYDGRALDEARARLVRLGVFETVSDPVLTFAPGDTAVSVAFDVTEARTSTFEGLLAYAPSASGSRLVGSLDLQVLNLAGSLRRARVIWARKGANRLSWSLYYREPRLLSRPFALETSLASDVVDTSYASRRLWLGLTFLGEGGVEMGTGGSIGATKDRAVAGEGDFTEKGLSFYLRRESRDLPLNPHSGSYFEIFQEVASLRFAEGENRRRTLSSLKADAQYIAGIGTSTNLAIGSRFEGVFASTGDIPVSHLVKLGGMTSLRGYPEEWFSAREALTVSLEARRLLGPASRIYVFVDGATLENASYDFGRLRGFPYGYGLGLMAATSGGIMRLEIALGRGDTWRDAKLHLGLVERF